MMKRLFCILAMWLAAWQLSFALAQTQEETAVITLSGESAQWTGDGVTLEDGVLTIGGTGVYRLNGSWAEGQIVVKAGKKGYVTLVLDGLSVSSSEGSALTVTSAKEVVLRLEAGSGNVLASTAEGEDAASALVSKADLFLTGEGSLALQSSGKHGIQAADSVTVQGGSYIIKAAETGLKANDFIAVTNGALEIASGEDGVRVSGDESKPDTGWIAVSGGSLRIASGEDGIQAETDVTLTGGSVYIESGDDGIRAENTLKITDGEITVARSYEGLEAAQIELDGGMISVTAEDDGINASDGVSTDMGFGGMGGPMGRGWDGAFRRREEGANEGSDEAENRAFPGGADGGMENPPEGVDGERPEPPDGMPFGGEAPERPDDGTSGENSAASGAEIPNLVIRGGVIHVNAGGDGLDSNGNLRIEGGTVIVDGPEQNMNGALDSGTERDGTLRVSGGTVLALGASGMDETFDSSSQQASFRYAGLSFAAGDEIRITGGDGNELFAYTAQKSGSSVVFSSPSLAVGDTVILSVGGETAEIQLTETSTGASSGAGWGHGRGRL